MKYALAALACWLHCSLAAADPTAGQAFTVIEEGYQFGLSAWSDPVSLQRCEFQARVYRPAELEAGPFPIVFILHGRHEASYDPSTNLGNNAWPPAAGALPIPNVAGYDYLARPLAGQGCIVVSVAANALTNFDTLYADYGDSIRARMVRDHIRLWQRLSRESSEPFGARFVGAIDWQRVGLIGHSRGGSVMVDVARELATSPELSVRALALLAATNYPRRTVPLDIPLAIMLGQLDGDVRRLESLQYFDDGRWQAQAARHVAVLDGGNHNFFNRYWDPTQFTAKASNDDKYKASFGLSGATQRSLAATWMLAFFRQYLLNDEGWLPMLRGEAALPAPLDSYGLSRWYQPPATQRLALATGLDPDALQTNDLGGAVQQGNNLTASLIGGGYPNPDHVLAQHWLYREVHWRGDHPDFFFYDRAGLRQFRLRWSNSQGSLALSVPSGSRDWRGFSDLQLRVGLNFANTANTANQAQDLRLVLRDGSGAEASVALSEYADVRWPVGSALDGASTIYFHMPRLLLEGKRIPLSAFTGCDLSNIHSLSLICDQRTSGEVLLADVALAGLGNSYPDGSGIQLSNSSVNVDSPLEASLNIQDPDSDPLSVTWHWGDGSTSSGPVVSHSYSKPGRYVCEARVSDGTWQRRFLAAVQVQPAGGNTKPTCSAIANQQMQQGSRLGPIAITVGDADGQVDRLQLSATSDNEQLIDRSGLILAGQGAQRQLTLVPFPGRSGSSKITVTVSDGLSSTTRQFTVQVSARTLAPVLQWDAFNPLTTSAQANERYLAVGSEHVLDLTIRDADTTLAAVVSGTVQPTGKLTLAVQSSETTVLPNSAVTVQLKPSSLDVWQCHIDARNATLGSTLLTLTGSDPEGNQGSCTVLLHFYNGSNQTPVIDSVGSPLASVIQGAEIPLRAVAHDPDNGPAPLRYSWRLRYPFPSGFNFESPDWNFAPSGSSAAQEALFRCANLQHLVDGEYLFQLLVDDGVDSVQQDFSVNVDNQAKDLIAWWPLDEADGYRYDLWQQGLHVRPQGQVGYQPGKIGLCAWLSAQGYLELATAGNEGLDLPGDFSIAVWCRPSELTGTQVLLSKHSAEDPGWLLQSVNGVLEFTLHQADNTAWTLKADRPLVVGQWQHVVLSASASDDRMLLYLDAQVAGQRASLPQARTSSRAAFQIGPSYLGGMDQLSLHKVALSAQRVAALQALGSANQAPLVQWLQPSARQAYASGQTVGLECLVVDPEHDPVNLKICTITNTFQNYQQLAVLAELTQPPYRFDWAAPQDGSHLLLAVADDGHQLGVSEIRVVVVGQTLSVLPPLVSRSISVQGDVRSWLWEVQDGSGEHLPTLEQSLIRGLAPDHDHVLQPLPTGTR